MTEHEGGETERPSLGSYLRSYRRTTDRTLSDLSKASGIGRSYFSQLETGKLNNPGIETLIAAAEVYGIPMNVLMVDVYGLVIEGVEQERALSIGRLVLQLPEAQQQKTISWTHWQLEHPRQ